MRFNKEEMKALIKHYNEMKKVVSLKRHRGFVFYGVKTDWAPIYRRATNEVYRIMNARFD